MKNYKVIGTRRFYELQPGDIFRAVIQDVQPGAVTIRFSDGETYVARSLILPGARIGDDGLFVVKENDQNGRIVLGMVKDKTGHFTFDMRV
jgi:hypothetical protein